MGVSIDPGHEALARGQDFVDTERVAFGRTVLDAAFVDAPTRAPLAVRLQDW